MNIRIEKTVPVEIEDVNIAMVTDGDGVVQFIDIVQDCPQCGTTHTVKRFAPIDDDTLDQMLSVQDDAMCDNPKEDFNLEDCSDCTNFGRCAHAQFEDD